MSHLRRPALGYVLRWLLIGVPVFLGLVIFRAIYEAMRTANAWRLVRMDMQAWAESMRWVVGREPPTPP